MVAAGCGEEEFTPPQDVAACYDLAESNGSGDTDAGWRVAVDDTRHGLDDPISVYVCMGIADAAEVSVADAEGVGVSPDEQTIDAGASRPTRFEVVLLDDDAGGRLQLAVDTGSGGGTTSVRAVVDGDEWSLQRP